MKENTLYSPRFEHDNCGIGAVVNIRGIKSHAAVENALTIVETLEHRAGKDADGKTGDGVGILLQISHKFFKKAAAQIGISLGDERDYGVGMFFFPQNWLLRNQAKKMFEIIAEKEGLNILGWRKVPHDENAIGQRALDCMPNIQQCFIARPEGVKKGLDFDRRLYVARRVFEQSNEDTYVVSLSSRTVVYKGMFLVGDLRNFFSDLRDDDFVDALPGMGKMHGAPLLDQYNGKMSGIRRTHLRKFKLWQYLEINIGIKKLLALIISQTLKKEKANTSRAIWTRSCLWLIQRAPTPPCSTTPSSSL